MAESVNGNKGERVEFSVGGRQGKFIAESKEELGLKWNEFAKIANTSVRNLSDWRNERNFMSLEALQNICKARGCTLPIGIVIKEKYWHVAAAAKAGGDATYKKYNRIGGDDDKRKEKWRQWWEQEGKFKEDSITKRMLFKKPAHSEALAEFVGIVLGDGGISDRQVTITLHRVDDKEYAGFVSKIIETLFDIKPGIHHEKNALADDIVISRTGIVEYLEKLGLKRGSKVKNQIDIPKWIKDNRKFLIACVRGLVDTDGSIFDHKYISGGRGYVYKKLQFTSHSKPLVMSVYGALKGVGLSPGFYYGKDIKLENKADMKKYFEIIGSHNPKHLKRYRK